MRRHGQENSCGGFDVFDPPSEGTVWGFVEPLEPWEANSIPGPSKHQGMPCLEA